jgi:hypothetical protein
VSFLFVCVVLCAVFCLSVVCYILLCFIVVQLPPGKNHLQYNDDDDDDNSIQLIIIYVPSQQLQGQIQTDAIVIIIIKYSSNQFNMYLFMCKLDSPEAN